MNIPSPNGSRSSSTADCDSIEELSESDQRAEQLAQKMGDAWRKGRRVCAEELLRSDPVLESSRVVVMRLLCEEMCLRNEYGQQIPEQDYLNRFPQWQAELKALIDCRQFFEGDPNKQATTIVSNFEVAEDEDSPADFEIVQQLGEGAQGRVYLAKQLSLGNRPVVLKISDSTGFEHLSLARLQHTNIVPLYWVYHDQNRNQRMLCMPYFGSMTLADLVARLEDKPVAERTGNDIVAALDEARAKSAITLPDEGPARGFFGKASYIQIVCWIGACLADALHDAHERGLVHLDVKPSNILLANDGQPMLLDFHLAREPLEAGSPPPPGLGGTPLYMPPEQESALAAIVPRKSLSKPVDHRADIYSLGLVLYQLLGGTWTIFSPRVRLVEASESVGVGLSDIIHKSIHVDPNKRYASAAELAADLRLHLGDQPLKGVPNRSWHERWRKWRRRRPHTLPMVALSVLLAVAMLGGGLWFFTHQRAVHQRQTAQIQRFWKSANDHFDAGRYRESAEALHVGSNVAESIHSREWSTAFAELLRSAKRRLALDQLHEAVGKLRISAGQHSVSQSTKRRIDRMCSKLWSSRNRLLQLANDEKPEWRARAQTDLIDVVLLWTPIRIATASNNENRVKRIALDDLATAEKLFGTTAALSWEKSRLMRDVGKDGDATAAPTEIPDASAWECITLGRAHLQIDRLAFARKCFDRAVDLRPADYWPNYYQGVCALRQKDYLNSLSAFRACIVAKPNSAAAFHNRAFVFAQMNDHKNAFKDYDAALRLDADFGPAYLHRGLLFLKNRQWEPALADLHNAISRNTEPATAHFNAAIAYRKLGQTDKARLQLRHAVQLQPKFDEAKRMLRELDGRP